jgi:hypothetical protein
VSNKVNKNAARAGAVLSAAPLMLLMSSPAFALTRDRGMDPGPGLSVAQTLGLYVVAPLFLFALISVLVVVGSRNSKR